MPFVFNVTIDLLDTVRMVCSQLSGVSFVKFSFERRQRDSRLSGNVTLFDVIWLKEQNRTDLVILKPHSGIRIFYKPLSQIRESVSLLVCFLTHADMSDTGNAVMLRCLMNAMCAATCGTYPVEIVTCVRNVDASERVLFRY